MMNSEPWPSTLCTAMLPLVKLHDVLGQRQADPGAFVAARKGGIHLVEALEDVLQLVSRDADPRVPDRKAESAVIPLQGHGHAAAGGCELEGIGKEVEDRLLEEEPVDVGEQLVGSVLLELEARSPWFPPRTGWWRGSTRSSCTSSVFCRFSSMRPASSFVKSRRLLISLSRRSALRWMMSSVSRCLWGIQSRLSASSDSRA